MQPIGLIFFAIFAIIQFGMYVGIRREWATPGNVSGIGVFASIVAMGLVSLSQPGNSILQAVFVGMVLGGLFSAGTLAIAMYFHRSQTRIEQVDYAANEIAEDRHIEAA